VIARMDHRDPVERAYDLVCAAEWDLTHEEPVERCACGATLLTEGVLWFVCAGCGLVPTYWLHPGASIPNAMGEGGRDRRSPESSAEDAPFAARKGVFAPGYSGGRVAALSAGLTARLARLFLAGWRA
jgi:hypothetical protein